MIEGSLLRADWFSITVKQNQVNRTRKPACRNPRGEIIMAQSIVSYVDGILDNAQIGPIHRRVLALISFAYFFDVIDFTITGALIPNILASKFFTDATPIPSVALFGLFVGTLGQGEFTDRFGRRKVLQLGILLYSIATIAA